MKLEAAADSAQELRRRAEAEFQTNAAPSQPLPPGNTEQLLHELQVHQIELEIQNEELRRAQADLDAERSRYFELYDLAPVGYLTISEKGLIQRANLAAAGMFGVPRSMLLRQPLSQFIYVQDQDLYYRHLKRLRDCEDLQSWEMRLKRSDVSYFWAHLQVTLAHNGEYWLTFNDITELKQLDEQRRASEKRYGDIFAGSRDGIVAVDLNGKFIEANSAYCDMIGYSFEELQAMKDFYRITPEKWHVWEKEEIWNRRLLLQGYSGVYEKEYIRKNGTVFPVEMQSFTVTSASGAPRYLWGIAREVTERKRTESEMRKLSRAVEQSPVTIMITDTQGTIEFINPKFTEMTGYSADEVIGESVNLLKSDKTPPETIENMWATISTGKPWQGDFVNKRKDGSLFYEHATISALRDERGAITQYVAVKEDITEKKSTMEQLLHSQKMESIGELAGGLAHDLNNILSVVNGYATLAQLEMNRDQKAFHYLDEITRASVRAAALTHSMLAYSRKQEMNQQKQNLNHLITTVGSFIKRITHDNITFTLVLQDDALVVRVDTVQIEQVLLNLATNARDAMPDGGVFSITTAAGCIDEQYIASHGYGVPGRYAVITVSDTGSGMDEKTRNRVFDPFFTTKEVGKGTGLGLSMVMGIIKQHGGFIDLQSEPGTGSVFQLFLPLLDSVEIAAAPTQQANLIEEVAGGTILVAEDDAGTRTALEEFLVRAGYTVITAIDGQDAVEKFAARTDEIDLVISDVVMPRKSGKAASDEIRKMSARVKFIFVSGYAATVIEREGGFGADAEVLSKPIMPYDLLSKIKGHLSPDGGVTGR